MTHGGITEYYDRIAGNALLDEAKPCGSASIPPFLAAPYRQIDERLQQLRRCGKTRFLDLCCGRGAYSVYAAKLGFDVVGVDISSVSIAAATQLAAAHEVSEQCQFVVGDALTSLDHEVFDIIFIGSSLYYLDLEAALTFMRVHLRDDGEFICIETYGDNPLMRGYRRARARVRNDRDVPTLTRLLGERELVKLRRAFPNSQVRYHDCLTLLGGVLAPSASIGLRYHALARRIDHILLNRIGLKFLSFRFVFNGRTSDHAAIHGNRTGAWPKREATVNGLE